MKRKNQPNNSKSTSSFHTTFKTGNLLSHPSGMETFREQSKLVQEQKKHRNDILMLNKSPHFVNRKRDSDEIDSDLENAPSDFKRYEEKKIYGFKNGKRTETILPVFRQGKEFSQFDDEEDNPGIEYDRFKKNRLNPEEKTQKKKDFNTSPFYNKNEEKKGPSIIEIEPKKSSFSQPEGSSNDSMKNYEVDPDFLAYLDSI